jgi:hypothetical protein
MKYGNERNTIMDRKDTREERKSLSIEDCINFICWKKLNVKDKEKKLIYQKTEMILRSYDDMQKKNDPKYLYTEMGEMVVF